MFSVQGTWGPQDVVDAFRRALIDVNLEPSESSVLKGDGQLHRYHVAGDKRASRNGWYVFHADGFPTAVFGTWKDGGTSHTWHLDVGRKMNAAERAESRKRIEAARAASAAHLEAERTKAREKSRRLWEEARSDVDVTHPYLSKKGVRPHGIRQLRELLLVPLRDTSGELHGLQFIAADGTKKFGRGTAKAGHYHAIAQPHPGGVLAICEGYATGATVHELTGWPVVVAFDAGNLALVAEALRAKLPDVHLVICADNDRGTEGNPGLTKARAAAQAVGGIVIAPEFEIDESGSDWNDFAAARGSQAAREALERGIEISPLSEPATPPWDATPEPAPAAATHAPRNIYPFPDKKPKARSSDGGRTSRDDYLAGFTVDDEAVWFRGRGKGPDEPLEPPFRVCPPLRVLALLRDTEQENWGLLIEFSDKDGHVHRWAVPWRMFSGSGEEMRAELLRQGFFVPPSQKARNLFVEYLAQAKPDQRARSVERTGWHGEGEQRVFVMPGGTIGHCNEPVHFQSESLRDRVYRQAGEPGAWRSDVADLCRGNSRLVLAVSIAFASMLLHPAEEESGGFHLRGGSSTGKTTALRVAASVFGGPDYLRRWRATDNALEAVAAMHNDTVLILDELAQVDPKVAGQAAYMLANGEGKQRAHRTGSARPVLSWRTLVLSAGEISLAEHMRQDGKKAQAGQEVRLADVSADAGKGYGLFETLHGYTDAAALSRALCASAAQVYGTAAPEFITAVLRAGDALREEMRVMRAAFCRAVLPGKADGQAYRAANRFALVAVAGELASRWGITGWEAGEADKAARICFRAWLEQRGGAANIEPARMVAQVKQFLERHGEARFVPWGSNRQDWVIKDRAGFRRASSVQGTSDFAESFYVLPETFKNEVCAGFDYREVARALVAVGALKYDDKGRKFTQKVRLPGMGGTPSCYVILPSIWETREDGDVLEGSGKVALYSESYSPGGDSGATGTSL